MIASGEKKEEYRETKPYWIKRLKFDIWPDRQFDIVRFRNGYNPNSPTIDVELINISVGKAKPEWSDNWQGEVFVIKLGEIIK